MFKNDLTCSQITAKYGVHGTQISNWKQQAIAGLLDFFSGKKNRQEVTQSELVNELYQQIGQLTVELGWLKKNMNCSINNRHALIDLKSNELSVRKQCELLEGSRHEAPSDVPIFLFLYILSL